MTEPRPTQLQRVAPEVVAVLADDVRVLNDRASDGHPGGGDVDCAVRGLRPRWSSRLREWRLCQALWYDAAATYYVLVRDEEILALDVLDDPRGIGRDRFATSSLTRIEKSGSLASPPERAAYLTLKRIRKGLGDAHLWNEIRGLAEEDLQVYEARLIGAVGPNLASEIVAAVTSGQVPPAPALAGWRAETRAHRGPLSLFVLRTRLSARRVLDRMLHPTGLVVAVVGPDGAGKSTISGELVTSCVPLFRRTLRMHFRPGVLPRPGRLVRSELSDPSRPHARPPHNSIVSLGLLGYHWLDALLGYVLVVAPARSRTTLVVMERGFLDLAVDPMRYRLKVPPALVRGLARLLPAADLTILLEAPAGLIRERKPELPESEIRRQYAVWSALLPSSSVRVDADESISEVVTAARAHIVSLLEERTAARGWGGWAALPSTRNPRLFVPRRNRAAALGALRLEAPSKPLSRLGLKLATAAISGGALRLAPGSAPPPEVRRALAPFVPAGGTVAVKRANHPGRSLAVVLDAEGTPMALAKVASDDAGAERLRTEGEAIDRFVNHLVAPMRGPSIISAAPGILVLDWIPYELRPRPWFLPAEVAYGLGAFFAGVRGDRRGRGPAHGDATPWNVLRSGSQWVLVDWENASDDAPPFFDVFHYLVQAHELLGRPRRSELVRGVDGQGWVGDAIAAYADGARISTDVAHPSFVAYLDETSALPKSTRDLGPGAIELRHSLLAEVSS